MTFEKYLGEGDFSSKKRGSSALNLFHPVPVVTRCPHPHSLLSRATGLQQHPWVALVVARHRLQVPHGASLCSQAFLPLHLSSPLAAVICGLWAKRGGNPPEVGVFSTGFQEEAGLCLLSRGFVAGGTQDLTIISQKEPSDSARSLLMCWACCGFCGSCPNKETRCVPGDLPDTPPRDGFTAPPVHNRY